MHLPHLIHEPLRDPVFQRAPASLTLSCSVLGRVSVSSEGAGVAEWGGGEGWLLSHTAHLVPRASHHQSQEAQTGEDQGCSPGQVFLLQAMEQASSTFSALPPSVPLERRSTRIKWLSEPPGNQVGDMEGDPVLSTGIPLPKKWQGARGLQQVRSGRRPHHVSCRAVITC